MACCRARKAVTEGRQPTAVAATEVAAVTFRGASRGPLEQTLIAAAMLAGQSSALVSGLRRIELLHSSVTARPRLAADAGGAASLLGWEPAAARRLLSLSSNHWYPF